VARQRSTTTATRRTETATGDKTTGGTTTARGSTATGGMTTVSSDGQQSDRRHDNGDERHNDKAK